MNNAAQVLIRPGQLAQVKRWSRGRGRKAARRPVDVTEVIRQTEDAVTLVLRPADGKPLDFAAGQYLTLYATVDGQSVKRAYSISCPPQATTDSGNVTVTVKRVEDGVFSNWALRQAQPGTRLHVAGPTGDFVLPETAAPAYLFAAAGSGITPVMSLIEKLLADDPQARIRLVYGNRREQDIIFRERIDALAARHPGLEVVYVLSRPGKGWQGETGRLRAELLGDDTFLARAECFVCGPGNCIEQLSEALSQRGVPAARIHSERYTAGVHAVRSHPTEPHPVRFAVTGKDITVRPGESVLEAGLRAGLDLPFSCTMGGCGHCKLEKRIGEVVMDEPNCLDPREREAGFFLACCAYPVERVEVAA